MISIPITSISCGLMGILALMYQVFIIFARNVEKVVIGAGSSKNIETMMRGHANLMENAPITMILLLISELRNYAPKFILSALAISFTIGRVIHAYAFLAKLKTSNHIKFRVMGMVTSVVANTVLVLLVLIRGIQEVM